MPNNSLVGAISGTPGSVGLSPTIPQTDAALSPRLLEILQYHESHKRTLSDTTPLNNDRRTATGSLPERPTSAPVYWVSKEQRDGGIMQRLGAVDQVQEGPTPSSASGSVGTAHSDGSTSTIADGSEYMVDFGTDHWVNDVKSSPGVDDARNGRGNNDARKVGDAKKPGPLGQQPGRPQRLAGAYNHFPKRSLNTHRDPAVLDKPLGVERIPSRSSSMRRGERTIQDARSGL